MMHAFFKETPTSIIESKKKWFTQAAKEMRAKNMPALARLPLYGSSSSRELYFDNNIKNVMRKTTAKIAEQITYYILKSVTGP